MVLWNCFYGDPSLHQKISIKSAVWYSEDYSNLLEEGGQAERGGVVGCFGFFFPFPFLFEPGLSSASELQLGKGTLAIIYIAV